MQHRWQQRLLQRLRYGLKTVDVMVKVLVQDVKQQSVHYRLAGWK